MTQEIREYNSQFFLKQANILRNCRNQTPLFCFRGSYLKNSVNERSNLALIFPTSISTNPSRPYLPGNTLLAFQYTILHNDIQCQVYLPNIVLHAKICHANSPYFLTSNLDLFFSTCAWQMCKLILIPFIEHMTIQIGLLGLLTGNIYYYESQVQYMKYQI